MQPSSDFPPIPCKVEISRPASVHTGLLHITKYELTLVSETCNISWLHSLLCAVDRKADASSTLFITFRHFVGLKITFRGGERDAAQAVVEIQKHMNPTSLEDLFCFSPMARQTLLDADPGMGVDRGNQSQGSPQSASAVEAPAGPWYVFDPREDFARMGVGKGNPNWRVSTLNEEYQFCSTYPALLGVPSRISDNTIRHIGKFRSKARIPSLSYIHKNNISITRSAQPMVGLGQARSIQDEKLVEAIFNSHLGLGKDVQAQALHLIIDARPLTNAMAQTAMGAGTENESNYPGSKLVFLGIENIHVVRDSFNKLFDACVGFDSAPVSKAALDKSGWLKHIKSIIDGAAMIITSVHDKNAHVLIHCSDGWDRTAQLSSLAQLCLDPYYRTIDGFMVLLEKEWISFGHKFKDRCGHLAKNAPGLPPSSSSPFFKENEWKQAGKNMFGAASKLFSSIASPALTQSSALASGETLTPNNVAPKEISPVFPQFLDCLYQIWKQYPTEFEFDERLLEFLFLACYSCSFGNFLFNNQKEAMEFKTRAPGLQVRPVHEAAPSVWQYIARHRGSYINPLYTPSHRTSIDANTQKLESTDSQVLLPSSANIVYWSRLYKISHHSFADEDAVLASSVNPATPDPVPASTLKKEPSLSYLDPTVPIGKLTVRSAERSDFGSVAVLDMVDLQSPVSRRAVASPASAEKKIAPKSVSGVVDNPLMSNPWS
ncbi:hypothetical protein HDV03_000701 [Kappamyces sp. JEL0829]|nr:hypothetical protein HDV03_000701 [Kappamyces sp. JEL0829]